MKLIVQVLLILTIAACDCVQYKEGIVIDAKSKLGIENVAVFKKSRPQQVVYTNASGFYEWRGISGGLSPKCPEPELYFIHPEYDTLFSPKNTHVVRMTLKR